MSEWKLWAALAVVVAVTLVVVFSTPADPVFHGTPLTPAQNAQVRGELAR